MTKMIRWIPTSSLHSSVLHDLQIEMLLYRTPFGISFLGILLLGGEASKNSMEYYYPAAPRNNRILTESMITPRYGHVSALLPDGRILSAGGRARHAGDFLASTELYNPESGTSEAGPEMSTERYEAAMAVLDGSIFVCGGLNRHREFLNSCEKFHAGKWTSIAPMNEKRHGLTMVALHGKLYTIRGLKSDKELSTSTECYNPNSNSWKIVNRWPSRHMKPAAAVFDDWIYVCGGMTSILLNVCERYDPKSDKWETVGYMNIRRHSHSLVVVNGNLYAIGGASSRNDYAVEMYDRKKNSWTVLPDRLIQKRYQASAVAIQ